MNRTYRKILRNRKQRIERRLRPKTWEEQPGPMLKASNIDYEMAERIGAMNCGGIGAMHLMVQRLGLVQDIDKSLELLPVWSKGSCGLPVICRGGMTGVDETGMVMLRTGVVYPSFHMVVIARSCTIRWTPIHSS